MDARVDAMGGEVTSSALVARVGKERRNGASFVLDVSVEAPPGITILFGPSGAGKSTLLDCIAGLVRPEAGKIAIGEDVLFDSVLRVDIPPQQRRIAYVFQSLALFPHLTVERNIEYGLTDLPDQDRGTRVQEILAAFRIERLRNQKPSQISGGERQRTALARSLVTAPRVLLLDEPLTGLDAELKAALVEDLRAWNALKRIPILYVTHSREEVDALGERVIAIDNGRVVSHGAPMDVLDAPRRKRLAQAAGFENLLSGTVLDLRGPDGVMRVKLGESSSCEIEVPLAHASAGDRVQVAIRAGDILLASERPHGLSARNILEGRMVSLEQRGTMCIAQIDCGVTFVVHVTPGAVRALELTMGKPVWLVLKTHSCHLVD
ncbi:MAG: molybdenum ABC transporter ATP-binding protein [Acidobacteria bacterium]|nr:MAG: molybdenum ABC transporter ATP-binding protein [Acidobacteriota bacterium]